jgi:hypothetical protein
MSHVQRPTPADIYKDHPAGLTLEIRCNQIARAVDSYNRTLSDADKLREIGGREWAQYVLMKRVSYFVNS